MIGCLEMTALNREAILIGATDSPGMADIVKIRYGTVTVNS